jgi:uncharacterized protein
MVTSPKSSPPDLPEPVRDRRQLGADDTFAFSCHPGLGCFTRCCGNVNIFLTPVDLLRLARRLRLSTGDFIDQHTLTPITKDLHLPVKMLRMGDDPDRRCPFVGEKGCTVYEDRPWACRMYPVGMALPPARAGVEPAPVHFLNEDSFCEGRQGAATWTVVRWRADQNLFARDKLEEGFRGLVSHPWFIGGRQLGPRRMDMFHTACYDLDAFRRFVFETSFLQKFVLEDALVARLRTDDDALLEFGFRWLRFALFGEPTVTRRSDEQRNEATP